MDFKKICQKIDKNESLAIHNYYQKLLALLFLNGKDPFNRRLIKLDVEKKVGSGLVDLFLKWGYNQRNFTEVIEVQLQPKKKILQNKIELYSKKTDLFSVCLPSHKLDSLIKVFSQMKKDLPNIHIVYLIDSEAVSKNRRKLVQDKNLIIGAHSPFILMKFYKNLKGAKEAVNSSRYLWFDALLPIYLKK